MGRCVIVPRFSLFRLLTDRDRDAAAIRGGLPGTRHGGHTGADDDAADLCRRPRRQLDAPVDLHGTLLFCRNAYLSSELTRLVDVGQGPISSTDAGPDQEAPSDVWHVSISYCASALVVSLRLPAQRLEEARFSSLPEAHLRFCGSVQAGTSSFS